MSRYQLSTPLSAIKGVGPRTHHYLGEVGLHTVGELLSTVPLRYEDRSEITTINELETNKIATIQAEVVTASSSWRGRRSFQKAVVSDGQHRLSLQWFNSPHVTKRLITGSRWWISGKINKYGVMVQPTIERVITNTETIHTGRLVPLYSSTLGLPSGSLRRLLKEIFDQLEWPPESPLLKPAFGLTLAKAVKELHFPEQAETVIQARERLAAEELLVLMQQANQMKAEWQLKPSAVRVGAAAVAAPHQTAASQLPFTLTKSQEQALVHILADLTQPHPMNRLLVGDVGAGKTVVAALAAQAVLASGSSVALIAPTKILARQHADGLRRLFPDLSIELLTSASKPPLSSQPTFWIGTHALLSKLPDLQPGLIMYDEQHRFGVSQRTDIYEATTNSNQTAPHVLTMSATPIPRTLMLTIFSHLSLTQITEKPAGRQDPTTWVVPSTKRTAAYDWVFDKIGSQPPFTTQALVVCPFIDPSDHLSGVAAVTTVAEELQAQQPKLTVGILHSKIKSPQQQDTLHQLTEGHLGIVVSTPVIEVGVDLPFASIMVIEGADRFGLASLHQLRGRVGRRGQECFCLLVSGSQQPAVLERLQLFSQVTDGQAVADLDLAHRGAGDLFGTAQHGFDQLRFASWGNTELIMKTKTIFDQLSNSWQPVLPMINLMTSSAGQTN